MKKVIPDNLVITEGIMGYWYYHLSKPENINQSLCGKQVMRTAMSNTDWGINTELKERYCSNCEKFIKGEIK
jgi:hypothetical protein